MEETTPLLAFELLTMHTHDAPQISDAFLTCKHNTIVHRVMKTPKVFDYKRKALSSSNRFIMYQKERMLCPKL
jgi:hypothetical protein